jgi:PPOX class probable F420-dependent enzyme
VDAETTGSIARVDDDLANLRVLWLSTTRPDGRPHVVPTWFDWDGDVITVFSKPNAQKVRNMRFQSSVMIALGHAEVNFEVELLEGVAEVIEPPAAATRSEPGGQRPSMRFGAKYRRALADAGFTLDTFAATYSQAVRIRLTRQLDWGARETRTRNERWAVAQAVS